MNSTVKNCIINRRSIRNFLNTEISQEIIDDILDAAISAPSAGNRQPWEFYVITNIDIKTQLSETAIHNTNNWMVKAPLFIAVVINPENSVKVYKERATNLYTIQDTAAAIENMLLMASAHNVGSCWVGAFDEYKASTILNLSTDKKVVAIIPFGYYETHADMPKRITKSEVVKYIK